MNVRFAELERLVDPERTYQERVNEIEGLNSNKKKTLQSKIQELEKEKEQLRNMPVAEIMQRKLLELESGKEMKLEQILVRSGYVGEEYLDYISLFHEGDISRTDYQFMLRIKNGVALEKDYKLQKIARVVSKISPLSFHTHLVLNFDILDYLLKNPEVHIDKLKRILEVLKDESELSYSFITAYLERTPHLSNFIRRLSKVWPNIWAFFEGLLEDDKKNQLFIWLITYLDNADILDLSKHFDLTEKIATDPKFPAIITDQEKMRDLLKILDIKFQVLDTSAIDTETLNYIFTFDHYELNSGMLETMIRKFGKYDHHKFNHSNYSALRNQMYLLRVQIQSIVVILYHERPLRNLPLLSWREGKRKAGAKFHS